MTFADMVLARDLLEHLDERQTNLILDALDGEPVQPAPDDIAALATLAADVEAHYGSAHPAGAELVTLLRRLQSTAQGAGGVQRRATPP